jgi:hypothetical protein
MGKSSHLQQGRPSHLSAQEQMRKQNQPHPAIQPKIATSAQRPKPLIAAPVSRPQPAPQVLQRKAGGREQPNGAQAKPAAPPAYRPQQVPKVLQTKSSSAHSPQTGQAPRQPVAPPVYSRRATSVVLQMHSSATQSGSSPLKHHVSGARSTVVQMTCDCGKSKKASNKHQNTCPEHPSNKKKKAEKVKQIHQDTKSIMNLYSYDSEWANKNSITEKMIKAFVKTYGGPINGHASSRADKDATRHDNTTKDINAFHSWYNQHGEEYR